ncbi:DinB family protein [Taibaiella koreensis]|uniref:DinB family protein n=1 Tax=Taibaiella koreensis TaxID=1268548 RepID=UPI000E5A02C3|nr:DinB family protein [Taibaiella koreensis]
MQTTTAGSAAVEAALLLYDAHTRYFYNVLDGISDADAQNRLDTPANHMAWLAGSLVQERYFMAKLVGNSALVQTSDALFCEHQGIKEGVAYPLLEEFRNDWKTISPVLRDILAGLSDDQLNGPDPFEMPGGPYTLRDTITFCTDRESYCIGQLGLWRRLLRYPAMKYD